MPKSAWDGLIPSHLENWLYGKDSLEGATRDFLIDRAKTWPDKTTFLDAGCGGGVTAYTLIQKGLMDHILYTGLDSSQRMLELFQKKAKHKNINLVYASIENMNYFEKFDRVLLRAVLAHVRDPVPIIQQVCRALKMDGILYVIFWNNPVDGPVIEKFEKGFYDIAHSKRELHAAFKKQRMEVIGIDKVYEKSARENHRMIWTFRKVKP